MEAGVGDLTSLSSLDEKAIYENLRVRFEIEEIYTAIGNILVAVNPYQSIPSLSPHAFQKWQEQEKVYFLI